jgi:CRISPR system Cascade subunit CasC
MSNVQLGIHVLTAYPPSNPNRDENGEPKSAVVNGVVRQRISSQCIKRAWRLSSIMETFEKSLRTRGLGVEVEKAMVAGGMEAKSARKRAAEIAGVFGKVNDKKSPEHKEMITIGHEEWDGAISLGKRLVQESRDPTKEELAGLQQDTTSVDVAMFGRMRAASTQYNVDAAIYVSHPLTTGKAALDADFWTSVDDLKTLDEEADGGSGGMGEVEFGSGTFYTYVQVNRAALIKNLGNKGELADQVILGLIEAIANVSPSGHKTTFGNEVRASYLRIEVGSPSGNLFCKAFEDPVNGTAKAVKALKQAASDEATAFGLRQSVFEFLPPSPLASMLGNVKAALATA